MTVECGRDQAGDLEVSPQQLLQLERILEEYRGQRGAVIPILQRTQDLLGYLPRPVLRWISTKTRIPLTQLFGVATFYAQFRLTPRGRHLVRVCDGTACHVRGAARNIASVSKAMSLEPGATSPDGNVTLEIVYCLGSCGLSPVALIDDHVCGRLQPGELLEHLKELH